MDELKINEETNFVSLEQAITEGANALIPFEFEYPNTDLSVEVKLKPITNPELQNILQENQLSGASLDIELLSIAMFNPDGSCFEKELLEKLPAGVVLKIVYKIMDISGMDVDELNQHKTSTSQLPGF